jgi:hypothetical protein
MFRLECRETPGTMQGESSGFGVHVFDCCCRLRLYHYYSLAQEINKECENMNPIAIGKWGRGHVMRYVDFH